MASKQPPGLSGLEIRNGMGVRENQEVKVKKRDLRCAEGLARGGVVRRGFEKSLEGGR